MDTKIGKNAIYSLIKSFSQVVFPMITFPYISRILQTENIGKFNFSNSIIGYITLISTLGITTYAVRECSKVRNDRKKLNQLASQLFSINVIMTIIAYIILILLLVFVKSLNEYISLIGILSVSIIFTTLGTDWINTAFEDFRYITFRVFIIQIFSIIAMFLFVHKPSDYYVYAIITVIATSGSNIANIIYRKKFCTIKFTIRCNIKRHIVPIITLFSLILSQSIFTNSDTIILGFLKGNTEVGLYSTSVKIYTLINSTIASIAWVLLPRMSYLFSVKDYKEINNLVKFSINFTLLLGLPAVLGIFFYSKEIILIIAGSSYLGADISLKILSIALLFNLLNGMIGNIIILPSGNDKLCLKVCVYAAILNIVLNFMLIPMFGLDGAAFSTLVSQIFILILYKKNIDKKIKIKDISKIILKIIVASLIIPLLKFILNYFFEVSIISNIITIFLTMITYTILLFIFKNEIVIDYYSRFKNKLFKILHNY